jgi:hypothetical protein
MINVFKKECNVGIEKIQDYYLSKLQSQIFNNDIINYLKNYNFQADNEELANLLNINNVFTSITQQDNAGLEQSCVKLEQCYKDLLTQLNVQNNPNQLSLKKYLIEKYYYEYHKLYQKIIKETVKPSKEWENITKATYDIFKIGMRKDYKAIGVDPNTTVYDTINANLNTLLTPELEKSRKIFRKYQRQANTISQCAIY